MTLTTKNKCLYGHLAKSQQEKWMGKRLFRKFYTATSSFCGDCNLLPLSGDGTVPPILSPGSAVIGPAGLCGRDFRYSLCLLLVRIVCQSFTVQGIFMTLFLKSGSPDFFFLPPVETTEIAPTRFFKISDGSRHKYAWFPCLPVDGAANYLLGCSQDLW